MVCSMICQIYEAPIITKKCIHLVDSLHHTQENVICTSVHRIEKVLAVISINEWALKIWTFSHPHAEESDVSIDLKNKNETLIFMYTIRQSFQAIMKDKLLRPFLLQKIITFTGTVFFSCCSGQFNYRSENQRSSEQELRPQSADGHGSSPVSTHHNACCHRTRETT